MERFQSNAHAQKMRLKAQKKVEYFSSLPSVGFADQMVLQEAEDVIAQADEYLKLEQPLERGLGGEVVPPANSGKGGMALTVSKNDAVALEASLERVELADGCGVYNLAFDAAEAARVQNPVEQMLVHQMAAAHKASMELLAKLTRQNSGSQSAGIINSAARLMDVYQKGAMTLHKIRNGGKQTLTVQHVNISDNAQAIVNNNSNGGGLDGGR